MLCPDRACRHRSPTYVLQALRKRGPLVLQMKLTACQTFRNLSGATPVWSCPEPDVRLPADKPAGHVMLIVGCGASSPKCQQHHLIVQNSYGNWCDQVRQVRVMHPHPRPLRGEKHL